MFKSVTDLLYQSMGSYKGYKMPSIMQLMRMGEESKRKEQDMINAMTDEELKNYNERVIIHNAQIAERRRIKNCIDNHICPNCDNGQLVRGKKEKNNDYKRPYVCNICGNKIYKEN